MNKSIFSNSKSSDSIEVVRIWCWRILLVCCALEMVFFYSPENLLGCIYIVYGWALVSKFVFQRNHFFTNMLPTLMLFGYGICYCICPIVFTLLEGKPLTFNFQVPYLTFCNQMISVTVMVASESAKG